jgi:hypothetical protein
MLFSTAYIAFSTTLSLLYIFLARHLLAQRPQRVELLVVKLCPAAYPWLGD